MRKNRRIDTELNDDLGSLFETPSRVNRDEQKKDMDDLLKRHPQMDKSIAGQIAAGNYSLRRYLTKIGQKVKKEKGREIDDLLKTYAEMDRCIAGQIVAGQLSLDESLHKLKVNKKKADKKAQFLQKINDLVIQYPEMPERTAKKIAMKVFTIEDYLRSVEKKKEKLQSDL